MKLKTLWTIAIAAAVAVVVQRALNSVIDKGAKGALNLDANGIPAPRPMGEY